MIIDNPNVNIKVKKGGVYDFMLFFNPYIEILTSFIFQISFRQACLTCGLFSNQSISQARLPKGHISANTFLSTICLM